MSEPALSFGQKLRYGAEAFAFLVFMGLEDRYFGRYLMPVIPMICLLAAYAGEAASETTRTLSTGAQSSPRSFST